MSQSRKFVIDSYYDDVEDLGGATLFNFTRLEAKWAKYTKKLLPEPIDEHIWPTLNSESMCVPVLVWA